MTQTNNSLGGLSIKTGQLTKTSDSAGRVVIIELPENARGVMLEAIDSPASLSNVYVQIIPSGGIVWCADLMLTDGEKIIVRTNVTVKFNYTYFI